MKLTRQKLVHEIANLIGLRPEARSKKAFKVINAVIDSMTEALLRGETIKIDGFGIFKTYDTPSFGREVCFFIPNPNRAGPRVNLIVPAKKKIVFKPSKALLKYINHGN